MDTISQIEKEVKDIELASKKFRKGIKYGYDILDGDTPNYLKWETSRKNLDFFWLVIHSELVTLNDYIYQILSVDKPHPGFYISVLKGEYQKEMINKLNNPDIDFEDVEIVAKEEMLENHDMFKFVNLVSNSNSVVVVYLWLIKTLKDICNFAEPSNFINARESRFKIITKNGKRVVNEFESLIKILDENIEAEILSKNNYKNIKELIIKARRIRNYYSHGEWDKLEKEMLKIGLEHVFSTISKFIYFLSCNVKENQNDKLVKNRKLA